MKAQEMKAWGIWMAFLLLVLFMVSCKSAKKSTDTLEVRKHFKFEVDSSLISVTKNEPSEGIFSFKFPKIQTNKPDCDTICQEKIDELLETINLQQKNGKNELKLSYDKYKKTLYLYNKVAGTVDSIVKHSNSKKEYFNITKTITITITTNKLTQEQQINVWIGRIFWVLLFVFLLFKIKKLLPI